MSRMGQGHETQGRRVGALLSAFAACVTALVGVTSPGIARAESGDSSKVDPFYGSFNTSVPIAVPKFHGIEPALSLSYSSTAGNDAAGMGWSLTGFSTIERASPGRGAPAYAASDIFVLDGQELVPCVSGSNSPSCLAGGTHSTEIENYQRIAFNATANTWTVTSKDGTKVTFSPLYVVAAGTYRWGATSVVETKGNAVSYGWWCDATADCYPNTASYNGTVVTLYREARPDPITFANGSSLGKTSYRIKTIDVVVSGVRARAYKLAYTTSASTSRSLLASVQQFGKDATLDGSGTVTSGSSLPPATLTWRNDVAGFGNAGMTIPGSSVTLTNGQTVQNYQTQTNLMFSGDFNGDGKRDIFWHYNGWNVAYGTSTGFAQPVQVIPGSSVVLTNGQTVQNYQTQANLMFPGDFNGDGKTDIYWHYGGWNVAYGTTTGFAQPVQVVPGSSVALTNGQTVQNYQTQANLMRPGDFNGDGKTDIYWHHGGWNIAYGTSTGFAQPVQVIPGSSVVLTNGQTVQNYQTQANLMFPGDFNGDGKMDIYWHYGGWNIAYGTSTGFTQPMQAISGLNVTLTSGQTVQNYQTQANLMFGGDFNGDGKTDIYWHYGGWNVAYGVGNGFAQPVQVVPGSNVTLTNGQTVQNYQTQANLMFGGDFNGDGKTDIYWHHGGWNVAYGTGTGFEQPVQAITGSYVTLTNGQTVQNYQTQANLMFAGDFNGDGKTDIYWHFNGWNVASASGGTDMLATFGNGLGGTTTISYTPSSAWSNTYLPSGMIVRTASSTTVSDGRGASATTNYSYDGGLWSSSERRFLGFRKVTAVVDAAGNYTETYYHQGVGCISKPDATYYRDAAGNIYSYSSYGYTENSTAPYSSLLTSRWDYECNLTGTCRRKLMQLGYDTYGNTTTVYEYGDYDVAGDERTTVRGYIPNTSAYLALLPAYENVYAGIGTSGQLAKQTLFRYDGAASYASAATKGLLTAKDRWNSQTGGYVTATFTNDAYGNQTVERDEDGRRTTHVYDPIYHVYETQRCNGLNQCTSYGWDTTLGVKTSEADANGTTSIAHDPIGRAIQIASPGATVTFSYVSWGNPAQSRIRRTVLDGSADGLWTDEYQDGIGRTWRVVKKGGFTKDTLYSDTSSRVWKESLWYVAGETPRYDVNAYDGAGRLRTVTHADGRQAQRLYGNGTETHHDELGNERVYWKDGLGNIKQVREKNGASYYYTTKQYDVLGNLVKVVDAKSRVSTYSFDSLSRRTAVVDQDMGLSRYGYSAAGLLTWVTDAANRTMGLEYDGAGRRTAKVYPDGSEVTWTYDQAGHGASAGRLTTVADATYTQSFSYGAAGQLTSETTCVLDTCKTIGRSYDAVGRVATVTYPDNEVVTNSYDAYGRLSGVSGYVTSIAYDSAESITSLTYANGTTTTYTYDPNRRWLNSAQVKAGTTTLYQASYGYDAAARVTSSSSTTNPLMNLSYAYDGLNRLTSVSGAQSESITYDETGNITSAAGSTYTYGDGGHAHAVTSAGANAYSYDANGNMVSGGGRTMLWDYDNRLAAVTGQAGTTLYKYNAGGQRIVKAGPGSTTLYFGQLADTLNGTLEKYYYAGAVLVAKQAAGVKSWYHGDHLGSIRLMTTATGAKANSYDYSAWGGVVAQSVTQANERGFSGHRADAESGLVYMNARYYDTQLRRFISADTLVPDAYSPQALNRYAYAYNNPISNIDPSGHAPVVVAFVAACVADTAIAYIGFAVFAIGYHNNNATLMTIGSVMLGYAGGGPMGAAVSAATSPLSPLSPELKRDIGWAYAAWGLYQNWQANQAKANAENPGTQSSVEDARDPTVPEPNAGSVGAIQGSSSTWDAAKLDKNDGFIANFKKIFSHNADKAQAVGIEGQAGLAGENGLAMGSLSVDSGFHTYGILHDTLIDTISYVTGANMSAGVGLWVNVASNVVLVGTGLKEGWFFQDISTDPALRSSQYSRHGLAFAQ